MTTTNTNKKTKDPNAVLDYQINWQGGDEPFLGSGETISTSTWIADSGITVDSSTNTTTTATVWLSGGTAGQQYTVTNRIVTNQARTQDQSLIITVKNL